MLLSGISHVAILTSDTDRFIAFYRDVIDATHEVLQEREGFIPTVVWIGSTAELNVFEPAGNTEHERQVPMFGRSPRSNGRIRDRLRPHVQVCSFRDPDGLEAEVCVPNPDAQPGVHNPPGTPALRYHPSGNPPPERLTNSPLGT